MAWGQEKGADFHISALRACQYEIFDFVPCSLPLKTLILLTFSCFLIRRRGKGGVFFWRSRRDSNPRAREGYTISNRARYDHFDTTPCSHLRKSVQLWSALRQHQLLYQLFFIRQAFFEKNENYFFPEKNRAENGRSALKFAGGMPIINSRDGKTML